MVDLAQQIQDNIEQAMNLCFKPNEIKVYKFKQDTIVVEIENMDKCFRWRMVVNGDPSMITGFHEGLLTFKGYSLHTEYYSFEQPFVPFKIIYAYPREVEELIKNCKNSSVTPISKENEEKTYLHLLPVGAEFLYLGNRYKVSKQRSEYRTEAVFTSGYFEGTPIYINGCTEVIPVKELRSD